MKLIIDIEKRQYEIIKYHVEHGEKDKTFEVIANGIPYEERPKGEWINQFIGGNECVMCSECKLHFDIGTNFCPNCGAKMKGGAE